MVIRGENKVVYDYGSSVSRLDNQNSKLKLLSKKSAALHHDHLRNFHAPFNEYQEVFNVMAKKYGSLSVGACMHIVF